MGILDSEALLKVPVCLALVADDLVASTTCFLASFVAASLNEFALTAAVGLILCSEFGGSVDTFVVVAVGALGGVLRGALVNTSLAGALVATLVGTLIHARVVVAVDALAGALVDTLIETLMGILIGEVVDALVAVVAKALADALGVTLVEALVDALAGTLVGAGVKILAGALVVVVVETLNGAFEDTLIHVLARALVGVWTGGCLAGVVETLAGALHDILVHFLAGALVGVWTGALVAVVVETLTGALDDTLIHFLAGASVGVCIGISAGASGTALIDPLMAISLVVSLVKNFVAEDHISDFSTNKAGFLDPMVALVDDRGVTAFLRTGEFVTANPCRLSSSPTLPLVSRSHADAPVAGDDIDGEAPFALEPEMNLAPVTWFSNGLPAESHDLSAKRYWSLVAKILSAPGILKRI